MATYPLTIPSSPTWRTATLKMVFRDGLTRSPFSDVQQAFLWEGGLWQADITLPPMTDVTAGEWMAFFALLRGRSQTFLMGDPARQTPQGEAGGTPLVAGASQTGYTLDIDGASLTQTDWLKAGDYIQLGSTSTTHLHMITEDADTNGSGEVTLSIWPQLRESPANNATVTVSGTVGIWRMAQSVAEFDINDAKHYGISFSAMEAVTA